jgi:hypothetical protein
MGILMGFDGFMDYICVRVQVAMVYAYYLMYCTYSTVWFYANGRVYYCILTHTLTHSLTHPHTHAPHLVSHPSFNWVEGATSETEESHYLTTREKSNLL